MATAFPPGPITLNIEYRNAAQIAGGEPPPKTMTAMCLSPFRLLQLGQVSRVVGDVKIFDIIDDNPQGLPKAATDTVQKIIASLEPLITPPLKPGKSSSLRLDKKMFLPPTLGSDMYALAQKYSDTFYIVLVAGEFPTEKVPVNRSIAGQMRTRLQIGSKLDWIGRTMVTRPTLKKEDLRLKVSVDFIGEVPRMSAGEEDERVIYPLDYLNSHGFVRDEEHPLCRAVNTHRPVARRGPYVDLEQKDDLSAEAAEGPPSRAGLDLASSSGDGDKGAKAKSKEAQWKPSGAKLWKKFSSADQAPPSHNDLDGEK